MLSSRIPGRRYLYRAQRNVSAPEPNQHVGHFVIFSGQSDRVGTSSRIGAPQGIDFVARARRSLLDANLGKLA
jgi:hypothetical protein